MKKILYKHKGKIQEGELELAELENDLVRIVINMPKNSVFLEKEGENYFQIFQDLRLELETKDLYVLCNGASINVFPSAMQLGMGGGDRAYHLRMGVHTQMEDIVEIFDYDKSFFLEGTVAEQIEFYNRWVLSKKKMEIQQPKYTIEQISEGSDFIFFWGHRAGKYGSIGKSCFSQWWPSEFKKDGIQYFFSEQWMMAEKARVFSDKEVLELILGSKDPKEIKELGRRVSFFDDEVWSARSYDIVKEGNFLKFSQNQELKEYLISTGAAVIVEASPYDRIWGIGMKQEDEGVENPLNWRGKNLLGFALMEVRDLLINQPNELDYDHQL